MDVDCFTRLIDRFCQASVFLARRRITARMIVYAQNGVCRFTYGKAEYLAW